MIAEAEACDGSTFLTGHFVPWRTRRTDRQPDRQIETQAQTDTHTHTYTRRPTERRTDRQDQQTDGQSQRGRETEQGVGLLGG